MTTDQALPRWTKWWLAMRGSKRIKARYKGKCLACERPIRPGAFIIWRFDTGAIHDSARDCAAA